VAGRIRGASVIAGTIVIDIGCATQETEESVHRLIEGFYPDVLFGFDPECDPGMEITQNKRKQTIIFRSQIAAWTFDGFISFRRDGICSAVVQDAESSEAVPCFDLSDWLLTLPLEQNKVILKLDCEGAEYPLLAHIHTRHIDRLLDLVLVEWHEGHDPEGFYYGHGWQTIRPELDCPVQNW
jgi:FkbM family methyltransferase